VPAAPSLVSFDLAQGGSHHVICSLHLAIGNLRPKHRSLPLKRSAAPPTAADRATPTSIFKQPVTLKPINVSQSIGNIASGEEDSGEWQPMEESPNMQQLPTNTVSPSHSATAISIENIAMKTSSVTEQDSDLIFVAPKKVCDVLHFSCCLSSVTKDGDMFSPANIERLRQENPYRYKNWESGSFPPHDLCLAMEFDCVNIRGTKSREVVALVRRFLPIDKRPYPNAEIPPDVNV
jgi:hypothetical protein